MERHRIANAKSSLVGCGGSIPPSSANTMKQMISGKLYQSKSNVSLFYNLKFNADDQCIGEDMLGIYDGDVVMYLGKHPNLIVFHEVLFCNKKNTIKGVIASHEL